MAALTRTTGQGVWNIIRFNWPFYAGALAGLLAVAVGRFWLLAPLRWLADALLLAGALPLLSSLAVSFYVYDLSGLYGFVGLPLAAPAGTLLTVNAGFDETTALLQASRQPAQLLVFDFYDPAQHTEASIARARAAYPPFPGTQAVRTGALPLPAATVDEAVAFLAAHEIRDEAERIAFFRELRRVLRPGGRILVTEHLRDPANFLAYTIGFLHFHSRATWLRTFAAAGLQVAQETKTTPFISTFVLRDAGNAP